MVRDVRGSNTHAATIQGKKESSCNCRTPLCKALTKTGNDISNSKEEDNSEKQKKKKKKKKKRRPHIESIANPRIQTKPKGLELEPNQKNSYNLKLCNTPHFLPTKLATGIKALFSTLPGRGREVHYDDVPATLVSR